MRRRSLQADVDDLVVRWVHWHKLPQLDPTLRNRTPVELLIVYGDEVNGTISEVAASKVAA